MFLPKRWNSFPMRITRLPPRFRETSSMFLVKSAIPVRLHGWKQCCRVISIGKFKRRQKRRQKKLLILVPKLRGSK